MDDAPWFDGPTGSTRAASGWPTSTAPAPTDLRLPRRDGVRLYFNQSRQRLERAARADRRSRAVDERRRRRRWSTCSATAPRAWSGPRRCRATPARPMRYVDLMGGSKPHLLTGVRNNLGAETTRRLRALDPVLPRRTRPPGRPWATRLPFPVHVVERVETSTASAGTRFVTRYAYHHGHFDGVEREFRGFGMVEQWDTEEFDVAVTGRAPTSTRPRTSRRRATSTWFHTGAYVEAATRISLRRRRTSTTASPRPPTTADRRHAAARHGPAPRGAGLSHRPDGAARGAPGAARDRCCARRCYGTRRLGEGRQPYTVTEQNFAHRAACRPPTATGTRCSSHTRGSPSTALRAPAA